MRRADPWKSAPLVASLCTFFLYEDTDESVEEAYALGLRRMAAPRVVLTAQTKKRFVEGLLHVAQAYEGISRQERFFVRLFWQEVQLR